MKRLMMVALVAAAAMTAGCASKMIGEHPGAADVALKEANQVSGCLSKGKVTVSVLAKVGFYDRSIEDVDANLLQMARNEAVDAGGDTVVKGARLKVGEQEFSLYRCRP